MISFGEQSKRAKQLQSLQLRQLGLPMRIVTCEASVSSSLIPHASAQAYYLFFNKITMLVRFSFSTLHSLLELAPPTVMGLALWEKYIPVLL